MYNNFKYQVLLLSSKLLKYNKIIAIYKTVQLWLSTRRGQSSSSCIMTEQIQAKHVHKRSNICGRGHDRKLGQSVTIKLFLYSVKRLYTTVWLI